MSDVRTIDGARGWVRVTAALLAGVLTVPPAGAQSAAENTHGSSSSTSQTTKKHPATASTHKRALRKKHPPSARTRRIRQAFVASAELQPMAQQLATMRTPEAYAGVAAYARRHTGESAAAAYLALGHAYLLDKRDADAAANLEKARTAGDLLADYADFLGAEAQHGAGDDRAAEVLLKGFAARYPDSIFVAQAPETEAEVLLAMQKAEEAGRVLDAAASGPAAGRPGFQLAKAEVAEALGQNPQAIGFYKALLVAHPLADEAEKARARLTALGAEGTLTVSELRSLADAYYRAHRYNLASEQYRALVRKAELPQGTRDGFEIAAAACDLKLKRLTVAEAEALPDSQDENGARRMYLLMELARDRDDLDQQQSIVATMETRFGASDWLAEALFSSGNMYMLRRDYPKAVEYYGYLAEHFQGSKNAAAAHWRAGWLSYRQGLYQDAARLFDEQIARYPSANETVAALYWRGRLYETQEHNPAHAVANYRAIVRAYPHYFYAQMARKRLEGMDRVSPAADPGLERFKAVNVPTLEDSFPDDNEHLAKAKLLGNAGLNEYIPREIAADPESASWSALAEAQIYASYGEDFRAMRALKRAMPYAASAQIAAVPLAYWRILFPEPYWETIRAESAKNHLDPYLVASLIRQESEFNPSVVSYANAWGLMQLLPPVGRQLARQEGMTRFATYQLLNPETNIRLGTRYLRQMLDRFDGVTEYALAAYNAGDNRVTDWQAAGPYSGMDEFVESIPFTQTREYVEAILRNIEMYKEIDAAGAVKPKATGGS
ncbi:MAG: transglycosylase SLT domain-containing protein [Acidobacteriota bacterium]|nr:transglycosylase SLT domain-containing protein [Acidobacteriota bacterium]